MKLQLPFNYATLCVLASLFPFATFAQSTAFTYQGRLNDGANAAAGIYDLRFAIYDSASGGVQQGNAVTNSATAISNGLFTVTLDFGNQFPGADRWLEIGVRMNGGGAFTTLSPRQPITAAPYAVQAANAGSVAAANINGTVALAQLPSSLVTNGASGVNISGMFSGNGSGLANVPGTLTPQLVAGTNVTALPNQTYTLINAAPTTVNLPVTATVGDVVQVNGHGAGGWQIQGPAGVTWTARESSRQWRSVASSADGSKLVAGVFNNVVGQLYTSTDSGTNWTARGSIQYWTSVASSADGVKLAAVGSQGQIYTSTDSGVTWVPREANRYWQAVASSTDGTKLVAVEYTGRIYTSTDSGTNWTARENSRLWYSVASSADGSKLAAVVLNGQIFTSTDSGTNWTARENNRGWVTVTSSADGSKLVAGNYGGQIFTSADSGTNWTARDSSRDWQSVASSADGSKLVAGVYGGQIYTSMDSGLTWTPRDSNRNWQCVASSADGSKLVAGVHNGQLYTSAPLSVGGAQGTAQQFQYFGNGVWQPLGMPDTSLSANVSLLGQSIESSEISDGTIVNADVNGSAAIADTKLATIATAGKVADTALSANVSLLGQSIESSEISDNAIVNADVNAGAAIAYSKLNLTNSIVNADISGSAAIGDTKLATIATAGKVADTALSANVARLNGTNVFTGTNSFSGVTIATNANNQFAGTIDSPYLKFAEVTTGTTQGGTANVGTNNWRYFNTKQFDTYNLGATNGAGDIVLPAGTYQCRISAPAFEVSTHQIRLRTSGGTTLLYGTTAYSASVNDRSLVEGQFTLASTTTLRVQHWCFLGNPGNGLGALDNDADIWGDAPNFNIFATAEFWKIK